MVNCLCELDDGADEGQGSDRRVIRNLLQVGQLRGVGAKGVEKMREGLAGVAL